MSTTSSSQAPGTSTTTSITTSAARSHSSTSTISASTSASAPAKIDQASSQPPNHPAITVAVLIGIIVGLVVLAILAFLSFCFIKRYRRIAESRKYTFRAAPYKVVDMSEQLEKPQKAMLRRNDSRLAQLDSTEVVQSQLRISHICAELPGVPVTRRF